MGYYLFVGLVLAFIGLCIFLVFKWEFESFRFRDRVTGNIKKHDKATTATSATDIATTPPGLNDVNHADLASQHSIASATIPENNAAIHTMNSNGDHYTDSNSSDNGGYENGGYDSGGYDSGGGYS